VQLSPQDKVGRSADGLSCSSGVPANASPAARGVAIRHQCGGILRQLVRRHAAVEHVSAWEGG